MNEGIIKRYSDYLSVSESTPVISLNEGSTPLLPINNIAKILGCSANLYVKYEGLNPTGSFKDRGMTMAISKAKEEGSKMVICASTGNTSASAAAYAARAKMTCFVVIPEGKIALGKLAQAMLHGAEVLQISGNFDQALNIVREIAEEWPVTLVNHMNPNRIQGQKTAAFEIVEQLQGKAPDYHFIPVGNAGNITAHWLGYQEFHKAGKSASLPRMMGYQAAGSAPIVMGHPIENPDTVATAIRIGNPISWKKAEAARDESNGTIDMVTDDEITAAQKLLAGEEGIFCEPASAASVAGLIKYQQQNAGFASGDTVVATLTGHGLKDPNRAIDIATAKPRVISNTKEDVLSILKPFF